MFTVYEVVGPGKIREMDEYKIRFNKGFKATLEGEDLEIYNGKINTLNGFDPCEVAISELTNNFDNLPYSFDCNIYEYLVEITQALTKEQMGKRRDLDAHKFFKSGYVKQIASLVLPDKKNVYIGIVKLPENNEYFKIWIATQEDGTIISGNCTCFEGISGTCSHVGAVLFNLSCIADIIDYENTPRPPMPYLEPKLENGSPKKIKDVDSTSSGKNCDSLKTDSSPSEKPSEKTQTIEPLPSEEIIDFLEKMWKDGERCLVMYNFREFADRMMEEDERNKRKRKRSESDGNDSLV